MAPTKLNSVIAPAGSEPERRWKKAADLGTASVDVPEAGFDGQACM
jgi:hypothetical protein